MVTSKNTVDFILTRLGNDARFFARAMFGEYALYAEDKVVALICDDMLYIKIMPASVRLADICEKGSPYPSAKPHYIITEEQLSSIEDLPSILMAVAAALPIKKIK